MICTQLYGNSIFLSNTTNIQTSVSTTDGGPVSWGCRIHQLHLCSEVGPSNECLGYNTKQSDGEAPLMLEL